VRDLVDDVITVSEKEIVVSMRLIWERMKVTIEPSAAVGLAAVMSEAFKRKWRDSSEETPGSCQHIGIILCGGAIFSHLPSFLTCVGNVDFEKLGSIFGGPVHEDLPLSHM
jgi:threonine dehydratase